MPQATTAWHMPLATYSQHVRRNLPPTIYNDQPADNQTTGVHRNLRRSLAETISAGRRSISDHSRKAIKSQTSPIKSGPESYPISAGQAGCDSAWGHERCPDDWLGLDDGWNHELSHTVWESAPVSADVSDDAAPTDAVAAFLYRTILARPPRPSTLMRILEFLLNVGNSGAPPTPLWACGATPCGGSRPSSSILSRSEGMVHAEGAPTRFMVASGGVLSEGYGHGGPGVCLGDDQTEAGAVPSHGGRGDALLRCMPSYRPGLVSMYFLVFATIDFKLHGSDSVQCHRLLFKA